MQRQYESGKVHVRYQIWIVAACLAIAVIVFWFVGYRSRNEISQNSAFRKTVHYRFQTQNTTNQPVFNTHFFVHSPLKQSSAQRCVSIQTSHPYQIVTDLSGSRCLKFIFENVPPYASKTVSIRAISSLADFHDWAEFYENGVWRIVDAQQRNFDVRYTDYIAMGIYGHTPSVGPMGGFHWVAL